MPTPNTHFTLHDSPIGLVLQIILISLVFGVLYLGIRQSGGPTTYNNAILYAVDKKTGEAVCRAIAFS